jgi:hypothetical protein
MPLRRRSQPDPASDTLADELHELDQVLARYPAGQLPFFGAPTRCPECGNYGMIDSVSQGRCVNHCPVCPRTWTITVRAMRAARSRPAGTVVGDASVLEHGTLTAAITRASAEAAKAGRATPAPAPDRDGTAPPPTRRAFRLT